MDLRQKTRKEIGALGERLAVVYLYKHGFGVLERNVTRKTGELDIVAGKGNTLHIVEVKTMLCEEFPDREGKEDRHRPEDNLHTAKIRKVARTGEWYVANIGWEGEWQVDGVLICLRARDGAARVRYVPQLL